MVNLAFAVEKAKSARSKCKGCGDIIPKDVTRFSIRTPSSEEAETDDRQRHIMESPKWYHLKASCIRSFRKTPAWWKTNCPAVDDIQGLDEIDDRDRVERVIKQLRALGNGESVSESESGESEAEPEEDEEEGSTEDDKKKRKKSAPSSPQKKRRANESAEYNAPCLTDDLVESIRSQIASLQSFTLKKLRTLLKANDQKLSGRKNELIERCAEGIVLGAIPKCPECEKGNLRFDRETGKYTCAGSVESKVRCNYSTTDLERTPWCDV